MTDRDEWFFRIKTATRALVKVIGTAEAAAIIAGVSRSVMQRWASPVDADIITLTAAMKLEAECGVPCITEAMAARSGLSLVKADGSAPPACILTAYGSVTEEFGDLSSRVADAIKDGQISPNEHTAICDAALKVQRAAGAIQGTSARLRSVGEQA
jgi:hypothetical protein